MSSTSEFHDAYSAGTRVGEAVLLSVLGQGGEGIVYEADHARLGGVLVKEYFPKQVASRAAASRAAEATRSAWQTDFRRGVTRFLDMGERLKALPEQPNVMRVYDVFEANNTAYLVMEKVEGLSLDDAISAGGFSDPQDVVTLADQLSQALVFLHRNHLFHRDISPDNIIVTPGYDWRPVLIDFNAAKDLVRQMTQSLASVVKPGYSPIELYGDEAADAVGPWTDVYAASAVLYRAITGRAPQEAGRRLYRSDHQTLAALAPAGYSPAFLAGIDKGLEPRPEHRPQSAEEWREGMGFAAPIRMHDTKQPDEEAVRQTTGWLPYAGVIAAALVLLVVLVVWLPRPAVEVPPTVTANTALEAPSQDVQGNVSVELQPEPDTNVQQANSTRELPSIEPEPKARAPAFEESFVRSFVVFFEWDETGLSTTALPILDEVAAAHRRSGGTIVVDGHTDRELSEAASVGVAQRRANAVRDYLVTRGVPAGAITTQAFGESRPAVQTADGVREPSNRRVEITLDHSGR